MLSLNANRITVVLPLQTKGTAWHFSETCRSAAEQISAGRNDQLP